MGIEWQLVVSVTSYLSTGPVIGASFPSVSGTGSFFVSVSVLDLLKDQWIEED